MFEEMLRVYKCPTCGGAVSFNAAAGGLSCRWCGNAYEAGQLQVNEVKPDPEGYLCPECGAALMSDDFIAADTCPFCGNNEVAPHRFEGAFEPDYVIPFSVTKTEALRLYEQLLVEKQYLPDDFRAQSSVLSVQGAYVPFWMQAGTVDFDFSYVCDNGNVKDTMYGAARRAGSYAYERVPADASERMADDMMDSIEPYDYSALQPFTVDCLPGFVAERFTVQDADVRARVEKRVLVTAINAAADTVDWEKKFIDAPRSSASFAHGAVEQALLPVWLIVVAYRGKKYLVGVNGQTGKVAVNLPIDEVKQKRAVRKEVLRGAIIMGIAALFVLVPLVVGLATGGFGLDTSDAGNLVLVAGTPVMVGVVAFLFGLHDYRTAKRRVVDSMQNVREAVHANEYDVGGLTITLREANHGPRLPEDQRIVL